ncbi:MAG: hypothetical protein ACT4PE_05590 [Candidatus Eiseniibacteriota bacterium]
MESVLRSSEFWVAIVTAIGVGGARAGWWSDADFTEFVAPALLYVVARVTSKLAKSVTLKAPVK